jgi:hypothetical protein
VTNAEALRQQAIDMVQDGGKKKGRKKAAKKKVVP